MTKNQRPETTTCRPKRKPEGGTEKQDRKKPSEKRDVY